MWVNLTKLAEADQAFQADFGDAAQGVAVVRSGLSVVAADLLAGAVQAEVGN